MTTIEKLEEYLDALEEYVFASFAATAPTPGIRESINQLWVDIARYGPTIPASINDATMSVRKRVTGLGDFEIPPPPPPPLPISWGEKSRDWVENHPWILGSIVVVGLGVGTGLLAGYRYHRAGRRSRSRPEHSHSRRQVVVVLGGDSPYGLPLILNLEAKGYIVITSVSSTENVEDLERKSHGFVRALVLDPAHIDTVPVFLRSLGATLSRHFPINAAGDPYASPSSHPYIHSIISLLTLPPTSLHPSAPFEHISLVDTYLPYITQTQLTPLQIIQSLLPLLRNPHVPHSEPKSIIICLPAAETRVGLAFHGVQSMSAVGTLRAAKVLRKEIRVAASMGKSGEMMRSVRVVVVDVDIEGFMRSDASSSSSSGSGSIPPDAYKAMEHWTASEKLTYGPGFISSMIESSSSSPTRTPPHIGTFVSTIIGVVSNARYGFGSYSSSAFGVQFGVGRFLSWMRGDRLFVGSSVYPSTFLLPLRILTTISSVLHSLLHSLSQPFARRSSHFLLPPPPQAGSLASSTDPVVVHQISNPELSSVSTSTASASASTSSFDSSTSLASEADADIESNAGETMGDSMVEHSWIALPVQGEGK
ncbi:hypothetical protein C8R41DRAFT_926093 [Lentinula lateritia]|uniref:DUF1776-domain-containing protein n=1 Tax=Lentinula lateritia TaxID=40482 RepID=A0ABQ8V0A9_9AGAR|nr:hypothetical protein C8R41DRAFT_926093 [Lentinula lateritia]